MARIRSPNYPQISLAEAIRRIEQIRSKEGRNPASRDVLSKLLGFGGVNGASIGVLSAVSKYGLLEDAGNKELKVSDLADSILFPHTPDEKTDALREAAVRPLLFAEIGEKWPNHPPSDENLRSYLMRRGFSRGALDNAIACYRETMALVTGGDGSYAANPVRSTEETRAMPAQLVSSPQRSDSPAEPERAWGMLASNGEPYQLWVVPGRLKGVFELTDSASADELIRAIKIWKVVLNDSPKSCEEVNGGNLA
jgi:hypothetical protein